MTTDKLLSLEVVEAIVSQILKTVVRKDLSDEVLRDITKYIYEKHLQPLEINTGGKLWSALKELPQVSEVIVDDAVRSTRRKRGNSMDITSGPVLRDIASDVFEKHYIPSLLKDKPSTAKTSLLIRITPTSPARVVGLLASIVTLIMFVYWLLGKL